MASASSSDGSGRGCGKSGKGKRGKAPAPDLSLTECKAGPPPIEGAPGPSTSSQRPDPYDKWLDPNSSPYINWAQVQIDQSGVPFRDRKWICLCCFKGYQQRFSQLKMMQNHIRQDHAVLQECWQKRRFPALQKCATCGKSFSAPSFEMFLSILILAVSFNIHLCLLSMLGKKYSSVSHLVAHTLDKHEKQGPTVQQNLRSCYRQAVRETGQTAPGWDGHIAHEWSCSETGFEKD